MDPLAMTFTDLKGHFSFLKLSKTHTSEKVAMLAKMHFSHLEMAAQYDWAPIRLGRPLYFAAVVSI